MSDPKMWQSPNTLPPAVSVEYQDGRGREVRFNLEEPKDAAVVQLLGAFLELCDGGPYTVRTVTGVGDAEVAQQ